MLYLAPQSRLDVGNFQKSFDLVYASEGGDQLTNIPGDAGGQTYCGISRKAHPQWAGWKLIDANNRTGAHSLVPEFYRQSFWNPMRCDQITSDHVAYMVYDFSVNAGLVRCGRMVQQAVGAAVDGVIGSKTLELINAMPVEDFITKFTQVKKDWYQAIVRNNPTQEKFLTGWLNRCDHAAKAWA